MRCLYRISKFFHPFREVRNIIVASESSVQTKMCTIAFEAKKDFLHTMVCNQLKSLALTSTNSGISQDTICDYEVVVSLTTYRERIHEVYMTIESIMQGTVKPNRIILWLAEEEFGGKTLPVVLQSQMKRGLEVRYCEDLCSYKKIIPSLKLCPDACIVTLDDDLIYEPDLLEHLIVSYKKYPNCVSACRTHKITVDEKGMPLPYLQWCRFQHTEMPSHCNFFTGGGGTLFPPHSLNEQVLNKELFMKLSPHGDDIWLNAMSVLNGVKVAKAFTHNMCGDDFIKNESPYVKPLWAGNKIVEGNDPQIKAVWEHFKLYELFR
ncbi:MAG: hypothetical protein K6E73_09055 [Bacteroidales bacterium]|nr:hypothetical protein [Bacteroidales bacterium]